MRRILLVVHIAIVSSLLLFAVFEWFPHLIWQTGLHRIEYFALRATYIPDPALVLVPRYIGDSTSGVYKGDLYRPELGVSVAENRYTRHYTRDGFPVNSAEPPFQLVLLGDSFVETGDDDDSTLSERVRRAETGLSTYNLGRSWYGPFQYLELLRRHAIPLRPDIVMLCFFAGNDIEDIGQYERWRSMGAYHFYEGELSRSFFRRYLTALSETGAYVAKRLLSRARREAAHWTTPSDPSETPHQPAPVHPELAVVELGSTEVTMAFAYWRHEASAAELLSTESWQTLRSLLSEFRELSLANGIKPVLVYIPTRIEVYGPYATARSGHHFNARLAAYAPHRASARTAFNTLATELDLDLIDLTPEFERRAGQGELLHHPFDTHWNRSGIRAAAVHIASFLDKRAISDRTAQPPQP